MPLLTTPGKSLAFILMTLMISACAGHTQTTNLSPAIATASHEQLLQHSDALYNPVQLQHVLASLQNTTDMTQWQQGLFYLRGYSYFGPFDKLTDTDFQAIANALARLPQQANFSMDEQFAVTLYLYFTSDQQAGKLAPLLPSSPASCLDWVNKLPVKPEIMHYGRQFEPMDFYLTRADSGSMAS